MKFLYRQNYKQKLFFVFAVSIIMCVLSECTGYRIIVMPQKNISQYHSNILTINSIFGGFALTNLGILLTVSNEQLLKKLEGTDILRKRNIVIGHSIIFSAVSILISLFWVFDLNFNFVVRIIGKNGFRLLKELAFNIEVLSLVISIFYFFLSVAKMIQLLDLLYVPQKRYSEKQVKKLKEQIRNRK